MNKNISLLVVTLFCAGIVSCTKEKPQKIGKEDFTKIYARLMVIAETVPPASDSLAHVKQQKMDSLFIAWKTSEKDFREMTALYQKTPEVWTDLLRMASREVDSIKTHPK